MNRLETDQFDPPRRVLVVDGDEVFRARAAAILRDGGYHVSEANGALAAMRAVLSGHLDVVVLDLVLPDGLGIEVARAFRAVATTRTICVVAIMAQGSSVDLVNPRSFGAETILMKPLDPGELIAAVEHCFGDDRPMLAGGDGPMLIDGDPAYS